MEKSTESMPTSPGVSTEDQCNCKIHLDLPEIRVTLSWPSPEMEILLLDASACRLYFCLDGTLKADGFKSTKDAPLRIPSGCCGFIFHPDSCYCQTCITGKNARAVAIDYPRHALLQLLGREDLNRYLCLASQKNSPIGIVIQTTPAMKSLLRLIEAQSGYQGTQRLLLAAKSVELLWLFFENYTRKPWQQISDTDRQAVHKAQLVLERQMADPPSLPQLAAQVGMSLSKFKQLFPEVCGHPPYGYLRLARMERAMNLLRSAGMSVTETALDVGYNSLSRFSKAFTEHFGFRPSEARKM